MASVSERHSENAIARFQQREKYRLIRLSARVRLDISEAGSEESLRAIQRHRLHHLDKYTDAQVTPAPKTKRKIFRHYGALRAQHIC
jgi:hypothetical protein